MLSCTLHAPAKINLYLEVIGQRPDNFHELVMVLQSIALGDRLELSPNGTEAFRVHCNHPEVPRDSRNLALQAAELMARQFPAAFAQFGGTDIYIQKNIPLGAGLAGGSADAAAVLMGLDLIWNLGLTQGELGDLGARLGSDVPFCLQGGTMLATGRGEKLAPLPPVNCPLVLGKHRSLSVATPWAYRTYREQFASTYPPVSEFGSQRQHVQPLLTQIARGGEVVAYLRNDLERIVLPAYPQVEQLRQAFLAAGASGVLMSGSGSAVFALGESAAQVEGIFQQVRLAIPDQDLDLWITHTTPGGVKVID